jgi:hypothetical protein
VVKLSPGYSLTIYYTEDLFQHEGGVLEDTSINH